MSATLAASPPAATKPQRKRGLVATVILTAVALHAAAAIIAGIVVVVQHFAEPPAVFTIPPKDIRVPVQSREHKMTMAKNEALAPKPTFNDRLVSTRPTRFALPEMPKVDMDQLLPLDPGEIVSDQINSLVGSSGLGSGIGSGGLGSGGTGGTGLSFFGLQTEGSRIVLLFDISTSVLNKAAKAGLPLSRIKEETVSLINKLPLNARFSIVQFSRNYKYFTDELLVASPPNKELARQWIETEWNETGSIPATGTNIGGGRPNGMPAVLDFAYKLRPDTIFVISDGSFQQTTDTQRNRTVPADEFSNQLKRHQATGSSATRLFFIGFEMKPEDLNTWRRLSQRTGGRLREIQ